MAKKDTTAAVKARAAKYAAQGNYDKAIEKYRKILSSEPNSAEILNLIGDAYRRMGEDTKAMKEFEAAIELFLQDAYYDNAVAVCKKVLEIDPGRTSVYHKLTDLYIEQGLVGQAAAIVMDWIKKKREEGDYKEVFNAYNKLIEIRPKDVGIRMKLIDEYIAIGKINEAVNQLEVTASLHKEKGRDDEAKEIERLILEINTPEGVTPIEEITEKQELVSIEGPGCVEFLVKRAVLSRLLRKGIVKKEIVYRVSDIAGWYETIKVDDIVKILRKSQERVF